MVACDTAGAAACGGTAGGVALLSLIQNAFTQLSISSYYQTLVLGAVIVAAVAIFVRRD